MMDRRTCFLAVFLVSLAVTNAKFFKFEDLSGNNTIIQLSQLNITPDPVNLTKNVTLDLVAKALRDIPEDAVLEVRFSKVKDVFGYVIDVPLPCLIGKFCTLPLCEYLNIFKDQVSPFFPEELEYGCPLRAGDYGGQNVEIQIPNLSSVVRLLATGKYITELILLEKPKGQELAHYKVFVELR